MVHRPADSRLLSHLITHEKEYAKQVDALLDSSSASLNSLAAYASASPPRSSKIVLAVAGSLASADDALRGYAGALEHWRNRLTELNALEDHVGNIVRDREILVTRVIKASKTSPKSKGDPISFPSSISTLSHAQSSSTLSFGSEEVSHTYSFSGGSKKMQSAQAELQACEAHLAIKERELEQLRASAIKDGLTVRCRALVDCGRKWAEIGQQLLEQNLAPSASALSPLQPPRPDLPDGLPPLLLSEANKLLPPPHEEPEPVSENSSIAPSQSASQINVVISPSAPIKNGTREHIYADLEAAHSPPSTLSHTTESEEVTIRVPPAHAITETELFESSPASAYRHTLPRKITEENLLQLQEQAESSDEEQDVQVVENPRFKGQASPMKDRHRKASSVGFLGSIRGLFGRHKGRSDVGTGKSADSRSIMWPGRARHADNGSVMSLPPPPIIPPSPKRSRTASDVARQQPHKLRRGRTATSDLPADEVRRRRRSASLDKDLKMLEGRGEGTSAVRKANSRKRKPSLPDEPQKVPVKPDVPGSDLSISSAPPSPPRKRVVSADSSSNATPTAPLSRSSTVKSTASSTKGQRRASSPAGSSIIPPGESLMSIVEGVAKANREGWQSGEHPKSVGGSVVPPPAFEVKAPKVVTREELEQELEADKKLTSNTAVNGGSIPSSSSTSRLSNSLSPSSSAKTQVSASSSTSASSGASLERRPSRPARSPLKSALRNGSRSPSPLAIPPSMQQTESSDTVKPVASQAPTSAQTSATVTPKSGSAQSSPRIRPSSMPLPSTTIEVSTPAGPSKATQPVVEVMVTQTATLAPKTPASFAPSKPSPLANGNAVIDDEDDDTASIASYETGREAFDDVEDSPHEDAPEKAPSIASTISSASTEVPSPPTEITAPIEPQQTVSVVEESLPTPKQSSPTPPPPDPPVKTARRKSVRVSLRPTFSRTPPAIEDDHEDEYWRDEHARQAPVNHSGAGKKDTDRSVTDMWADSSDDDSEYETARRLLKGSRR